MKFSDLGNLPNQETGHKVWFHIGVFLVAFLILFSRRPDALLHAQFYAEDGKYWYADAYQSGWRCLLLPLGGYLNTTSRLIGLFTQLFPLSVAPLVFNLFGLIAQILPASVFLSSRFSGIPFYLRVLGSLVYLGLPNSFELHANTTNLHWHLALLGCLVVLGRQDDRTAWRVFDFVALAAVALAGPFGILLLPVAAFLRWKSKDSRFNLALAALIPPAALQIIMILAFSGAQRDAPLGVNLERLNGIVGGQLFLSSILGVRTFIQLYFFSHLNALPVIESVAAILGALVMLYAVWRGPLELKLFVLFAVAVMALGLARPLASEPQRLQWEALQVPGCGNRYYFFPMVAFLTTLVWIARGLTREARILRYFAFAVLALLPVGVFRDWRYRAFTNYHFPDFVTEFERAAPGTRFVIDINPGMNMQLTKR